MHPFQILFFSYIHVCLLSLSSICIKFCPYIVFPLQLFIFSVSSLPYCLNSFGCVEFLLGTVLLIITATIKDSVIRCYVWHIIHVFLLLHTSCVIYIYIYMLCTTLVEDLFLQRRRQWKPVVALTCHSDFFVNFVFCLFTLNIDLLGGGNSSVEIALARFFGLLITTLNRSLVNESYQRLALDS